MIKHCADCRREYPDFYKDREATRGSGSYCQIHVAIRNARATTKQRLRDAIYILRMKDRAA